MNTHDPGQSLARVAAFLPKAYRPEPEPRSWQEHFRGCARTLSQLEAEVPPDYRAPVEYHRARFLALAGETSQAISALDTLLKEAAIAPEVIWLKIQLAASGEGEEAGRLRWKQEERIGKLLPLSPWGSLRDAALERQEAERSNVAFTDSPRPVIPLFESEKLRRIAELYEDMNFCGEAANAHREAIYCGFAPPGFPTAGPGTWMSAEVADLWLRTARCEAAIHRNKQAVQALLMSVASGKEKQQSVSALIARMFEGRPQSQERKPDVDKLTEIARLYCDCNVHPRAMQALDEAAKIEGADVAALRQKTELQWETLVRQYASGRERTCFLFGHNVAKTPNRMDLAPPPLSR